jgi:hypothetical protein
VHHCVAVLRCLALFVYVSFYLGSNHRPGADPYSDDISKRDAELLLWVQKCCDMQHRLLLANQCV